MIVQRVIKAVQRLGFTLEEVAELAITRDTLLAALAAGCDNLTSCAATVGCPLPLAGLAAPGKDS